VRVQDESDEGRGEEGRREGGEVCYDLLEYLRKKGLWLYDCDFFFLVLWLSFSFFVTWHNGNGNGDGFVMAF
jgi:hypothetical protein